MFDQFVALLTSDSLDLPGHPLVIAALVAYWLLRDILRMRFGMQVAKLLKKDPEHAAEIIDATLKPRRGRLPPGRG